MDDALLDIVLARLDRMHLAPEPAGLLLAACEGDDSLNAQLSGAAGQGSCVRQGGVLTSPLMGVA